MEKTLWIGRDHTYYYDIFDTEPDNIRYYSYSGTELGAASEKLYTFCCVVS